jgi:predicted MFS family arabinose efflux permease
VTSTTLATGARLDRRLVAVMAVACGAAVANLYYAQPLLRTIAGAFGTSDGTAGLLVTVSQVFYAIGLILLVPLGDLVDRRRLIARLLAICTLGLIVMAAAPSFALLAGAMAVVATTSVVVQILVPFASTLAAESERGQVVGMVMSGLLTGILLARTVSGLLAGAAGWRAMFVLAAAMMAVLGAVLWRVLPRTAPPASLPYRRLLVTVAELVRDEALLRRRMAYGALGFAGFSLVWTTIAFLLSDAPFRFGETTIGLFGLAGLAGALGAQGLGRLADSGHGRPATGLVLGAILASWGVLALSASSVVGVVLGLVLLDFGVQGQNVLSQHVIYGLGAENASRVTTAYVTSNFLGGALGSAAGSVAWGAGGWSAVCAVGAVIAALALVLWLTERRSQISAA